MKSRAVLLESVAVAALLLLFWVMAVTSVREKSTTFDEVVHITSGYSSWTLKDYRFTPKTGVFTQRIAAIPLLLKDLDFPPLDPDRQPNRRLLYIADQFFYGMGNDPGGMLFPCRAATALLGVVLGAVVYLWSRRLFGTAGALISLTCYVFSPTFLAHGRLATSDLNASLFFLLAAGAFWTVLHRAGVLTVAASALCVSGLLLAKVSGMLAVLIMPALLLVRLAVNRPLSVSFWPTGRDAALLSGGRGPKLAVIGGALAAHGVIIVAVIWAAYGFRYSASGPGQGTIEQVNPAWEEVIRDSGTVGGYVAYARERRLLPEAYLYGIAGVFKHAAERPAFLNGRFSMKGWWYFFPYTFLVKTPLTFFLLLITAVLGIAAKGRQDAQDSGSSLQRVLIDGLYRTTPLWMLFTLYWLVSLMINLNIGHRHIMPTYPPLFVLAGGAGWWVRRKARLPLLLTIILLVLTAADSLGIRPHYLAYFNRIAGGPRNGYRHLVDSSLDWGQDLPGLGRWLERNNGEKEQVYLSYFGAGSPRVHGIESYRLPGFLDWEREIDLDGYGKGIYCISATMLATLFTHYPLPWTAYHERELEYLEKEIDRLRGKGVRRLEEIYRLDNPEYWAGIVKSYDQMRFSLLCRFLREREPDAMVGYSILIYRLDRNDLVQALGKVGSSGPTAGGDDDD